MLVMARWTRRQRGNQRGYATGLHRRRQPSQPGLMTKLGRPVSIPAAQTERCQYTVAGIAAV